MVNNVYQQCKNRTSLIQLAYLHQSDVVFDESVCDSLEL